MLKRFRSFKGYRSALVLMVLIIISLLANVLANSKPLIVYYDGQYYFPLLVSYPETVFGGDFDTETQYKDPFIQANINSSPNWAIHALVGWDYKTIDYASEQPHPHGPTAEHWLGTDDRGRDVLARLIYGLRVSLFFGLTLAIISSFIGIIIGGVQGYFGGWIDLSGQRLIEVWGSLPELYLLIILSVLIKPGIGSLIIILSVFGWIGLSAYVRAEFLRARQLNYVEAARSMGMSTFRIIWRHILPNTLMPVITFFPFRISGAIVGLTSLDFLNLGVPSPTPSLGELLRQSTGNISAWWMSISTVITLFVLVLCINFVGEGVLRELDPRRQTNFARSNK